MPKVAQSGAERWQIVSRSLPLNAYDPRFFVIVPGGAAVFVGRRM
jgi:hypothetical protein